jgi:hypothetical protein
MSIGIVIASNVLFLISYTFSISWLGFGLNGYTIMNHKVQETKIKEFVNSLPFYIRFWYTFLSEDEFHKDPARTLASFPNYSYAFWYCLTGVVFLAVCFAFVVAILLYSIWIGDRLTILNCILISCVFFGGIGWIRHLNSKLIA